MSVKVIDCPVDAFVEEALNDATSAQAGALTVTVADLLLLQVPEEAVSVTVYAPALLNV